MAALARVAEAIGCAGNYLSPDALMELRLHADCAGLRQRDGTHRQVGYTDQPELGALYEDLLHQHKPTAMTRTTDFAANWSDARWRGHVYHHSGGWSVTFRLMPPGLPALATLEISPATVLPITRGAGLVLFCGPTGCGKSTTLAAVMEELRQEGVRGDAVTIEQPIEFLYDDPCVQQREVGTDTHSFADGVIEAMRQTPDTIVIGEIRSRDTAEAAIQAGLTGHRVLTTLHCSDIPNALGRMRSMLPADQYSLLPEALSGLMAQHLIPLPNRWAMPVYEALHVDEQVRSIIERGGASLSLLAHEFRNQGSETIDSMRARLIRSGMLPRL